MPGFRIPAGSKVDLRRRRTSKPGPRARGQEPGAVEPDAVVVADRRTVGGRGVDHGIPGLSVVALAPLVVVLGTAPAEREVEACAVGVGVGLVRRRGEGALNGGQRGNDLVEEAGQRGPRPGHLGGVDDDATAPQGRQCRDVVAVAEPTLHELAVEREDVRRAALVVDDRERGRQDGGVGLVEDDEHVGVGLIEVAGRLRLVVEAQHRRRRSPAQDLAAGLETAGERGEAEGATLLGASAGGGGAAGPR